MNQNDIAIRLFVAEDSISKLTELLHIAYRSLAEQGFKYLASHQGNEKTLERIKNADCYIAVFDKQIIGTISYYNPKNTKGTNWYDQPEVSRFGQFAIHPDFQKKNIGSKLLLTIEEHAKKSGAKELALDTAEGATDLINYYSKRNYRFIEYAQWEVTNYRSAIMSKKLF